MVYLITPWQVLAEAGRAVRVHFMGQAMRYGLCWIVLGTLVLGRLESTRCGRWLFYLVVAAALGQGLLKEVAFEQPFFAGQPVFLSRWYLLISLPLCALIAWYWPSAPVMALRRGVAARIGAGAVVLVWVLSFFFPTTLEARRLLQDERYSRIPLHCSLENVQLIRSLSPGAVSFIWGCNAPYVFYGHSLRQQVHPKSSRRLGDSILNVPWRVISAELPDVVYVQMPGRGDASAPLSAIPEQVEAKYRLLEANERCILLLKKDQNQQNLPGK